MATREELLKMAQEKRDRDMLLQLARIKASKQASGEDDSNIFQDIASGIGSGLQWAGEQYEKYNTAPARAALGALEKGEGITGAGKAFYQQFGEDPSLAPTGEQLAPESLSREQTIPMYGPTQYAQERLGFVPEDQVPLIPGAENVTPMASPAGLAGFGIEMAADPLNFVPFEAVAKGVKGAAKIGGKVAAEATKAGAKGVLRGTGKVADVLTASNIGSRAAHFTEESARGLLDAIKSSITPAQAEDYGRLLETAKKVGLKAEDLPDAVEFGERSTISIAERSKGENPLGEPFRKKYINAQKTIINGIDDAVRFASGGEPVSAARAGQLIRGDFDKWAGKVFQDIDLTYDAVWKMNPRLNVSQVAPEVFSEYQRKLNGLEKIAKGRAKRATSAPERSQAKDLLKTIEILREPKGNFKQSVEQLRSLGRTGFKRIQPGGMVPPDVQSIRDLYFDTQNMLIEATRATMGDKAANGLIENNAKIKNFLTGKSYIGKTIQNDTIADENVFAKLVERGDSKQISTLMKFVSPKTRDSLKGAFMESVIKKNREGVYDFVTLYKHLSDPQKANVLKSLFHENELNEIFDLIELGQRIGKEWVSSSQTSKSNVFQDIWNAMKNGITNDAIIDALKRKARGLDIIEEKPIGLPPILGGGLLNRPRIGTNIPGKEKFFSNIELNNLLREVRKYGKETGEEGDYFLRLDRPGLKPGDTLKNSRVYEDGNLTGEVLPGTSVIDELLPNSENAGYFNYEPYIVRGTPILKGSDPGEVIIENAEVVKSLELPRQPRGDAGNNGFNRSVSPVYKYGKPASIYYNQTREEPSRSPQSMGQPIPAKMLDRNILPSDILMGSRGKFTQMALQKLSQQPDQIIGQAQSTVQSTNIFDGIHQVMQNQDLNHLSSSVSYYNKKYGVEISKDILANIAGIEGVITAEKLFRSLSTIPAKAREEVINDFASSFDRSESKTPIVIPEGDRLGVVNDIKKSRMDSIAKAKAIRSIIDNGVVSPLLYRKVIFPSPDSREKIDAQKWKRRVITGGQ